MWNYLLAKKKLRSYRVNVWFEVSLIMLFICSLGAWGVAVVQFTDPTAHLMMKGLTHFFLATFTEGWVLIVVLGILIEGLSIREEELQLSSGWLVGLIAIGAPLTFPFGITESLLSPMLLNVARIGGILVAGGMLLSLYLIFKSGKWRNTIWLWTVVLLLIKAVMLLGAAVLPSEFWLSDHPLRILYLHILLLGALTLSSVGWLHQQSKVRVKFYRFLGVGIITVLVSLVMMTRLWPPAWSGIIIFYIVAGATLIPVIGLIIEWWKLKSVTKV